MIATAKSCDDIPNRATAKSCDATAKCCDDIPNHATAKSCDATAKSCDDIPKISTVHCVMWVHAWMIPISIIMQRFERLQSLERVVIPLFDAMYSTLENC